MRRGAWERRGEGGRGVSWDDIGGKVREDGRIRGVSGRQGIGGEGDNKREL